MGRKPKKHQWTDDLVADLLKCHHIAQLQKEEGSTKGFFQIVFEEWSKDHAHHKTTKGALKIKLTNMKQQGLITNNVESTEPRDPEQDTNMNILNQSVAAIEFNDAVETLQSTPCISTAMDTEPCKQYNDHIIEHPLPASTNDIDATTTIVSNKSKRKSTKSKRRMWNKKMTSDLTACYNIARNKSYNKNKSRAKEILKETRKLWLQRHPSKAVPLTSIRLHLSRNPKAKQLVKKDRKSKELSKTARQDPKATCIDADSQFAPSKKGKSAKKNKSSNEDNNNQPKNNLTTDPERLRKMKLANEKLASKTIFAHVCYNCGRLMIKNKKNNGLFKFDPEDLENEEAPAKTLFPNLADRLFKDQRGNFLSCKNCRRGPFGLYDCSDPETGAQYVPEAIKALTKPYELAQISLAGLINRKVKERNDRLKVWDHFQGQANVMQKFDDQYYGMYGFMVARDVEQNDESQSNNDSNTLIKRALINLRQINHLYQKFFSNYDTLYRYHPERIVHLNDASRFTDDKDLTLAYHLKDELTGIVMSTDEPGDIPNLDPRSDVAGVQHPRPDYNKHLQELIELTKVRYNDMYLEAKIFPHLFPFATGGWTEDSPLKQGEYLKHRLLNYDNRWRKDPSFSYYFYDRLIKQRLFYVAHARIARTTGRVDSLTAGNMRNEHSNSFYDKLGQVVPAQITGSRSYWSSKLLDLLAMSRKFGQPSFFITLTQNDNWIEIQNYIHNGPGHDGQQRATYARFELNDIYPGKDYSVETVEAYNNRLKLFKEQVLFNKNGPLGEVIDFWDRKEFQSRGAIHNHMVVWCKEGTVPDNVVCAELPRGDDKEPMVAVLRSYVERLQVHRCRKDKCIKDSYINKSKKCKYGFPYPMQEEEGLNKAGNRFLPRRTCKEDSNVVPYNPEILLLWGAHMNIQKVTASGWEMYLAKYVAKTEPSFSLQVSKGASDPEKYIRTRIVGRLEVDHINLGHFLSSSSRQVIYLPTEINPEYSFLKRKEHLPHDQNSTEVFYDNLLQKYMDRPAQLEHMLYEEWASKYMPDRNVARASDAAMNSGGDDSDTNAEPALPAVLTDLKGRKWRRRNIEAIPRWRFFMPNGDNQENFYMQKLVLNLPLRRDMQILSPENQSQTYLEECALRNLLSREDDALNSLHDAQQRGFSLQRLRRMAQQLRDMDWIGQDEFNTFIEEATTIQHDNGNDEQREVTDADIETEEADMANLLIENDAIDLGQYVSTFSESQRKAFDYITQSLSTGKQVLTAIIGEAGTGKSYLLKGIVEHATRVLHMSPKKLATTGVAAHLISGETLHHFFSMDIDAKSRLESGTIEYDMVNAADLLIIDEFSLLESKPFHAINRLLCQMAQSKNNQFKPFGGKNVILMGDPAQLPAIQKDIFESSLWRRFNIAILKDVKRQNNAEFQKLLSTVRLGTITDEVDKTLQSRVLTNCDLDQLDLDDAAIICSLRRERSEWNDKFLATLQTESVTFEAEDTDLFGKPLKDSDKLRIRKYHRERLEDSLTLKVGARVVLTKNIDIAYGWTNGTLAVVTCINKNSVTLQHLQTNRKTVVTKIKQKLGFPGCNVKYMRQQFPIILGWALTVHKVQGMTLSRAYVQLSKSFFASGQAYVALSRVKTMQDLHLLKYDRRAIRLDPFYDKLLKWMASVDVIANEQLPPVEYPERPKEERPCSKSNKRPHEEEAFEMENAPTETCRANDAKNTKRPRKEDSFKANNASMEHVHHMPIVVDDWPSPEPFQLMPRATPFIRIDYNYSNLDLIIRESNELNRLNQELTIDLRDPKESFLAKRHIFEQMLIILRARDIRVFDSNNMTVDAYQQHHLHPILQGHLKAIPTLGDGNCCFYSIWKQTFRQQEGREAAYLMRLLTLYIIYRDHDRYLDIARQQHIQLETEVIERINTMNSYCGEVALIAIADAFNRPIYSYATFINERTGNYHYEDADFDYLKQLFRERKNFAHHHRLFEPFSQPFHGREPYIILSSHSHFTTCLYESRPVEHLVPFGCFVLDLTLDDPVVPNSQHEA